MRKKMKALTIHGKLDMRLDEVLVPEPQDDQVRIRMAYAGICGSDLHYYNEGGNGSFIVREPLVPGHELSGNIDFDPSGSMAKGTPITIHPATFGDFEPGLEKNPQLWSGGNYLGSASTWPHTQGGMVEYLVVHRNLIRIIPGSLDLRHASLAEPLAVSLHAINVAGPIVGKKVLVSGSGPIGLLTAAAAIISGAGEVVSADVLPGPLERARELGVSRTIRIGKESLPDNYFDVVFECSGVSLALSTALVAVCRSGVVVQVGMFSSGSHPIEISPLVAKEVQLRGAFRFNNEIDEAITILDKNPWIGRTITHIFPVARGLEAFEIARDSEASGKVLIDFLGEN